MLEQKGLTQYGVKFFAGFIQQTVRMFINKSDGEPAMEALKDAAAKSREGWSALYKKRQWETAATEGTWCMWSFMRPRSLMTRKKTEAEQGAVACDLLQ